MRTAILTVSHAVARREEPNDAGTCLASLVEDAGAELVLMEVVPNDLALIEDRLHHFVEDACELVLTVGGIGPATDGLVCEATRTVIELELPGVAEAIRAALRDADPRDLLTRGTSGMAGGALIVNLPAGVESVRRSFGALRPLLGDAVRRHGVDR